MHKIFTPSYLKKLLVAFAFLGVAESVFTYTAGPPAGYTNAPGNSNCTGCHSGSPITSGTQWSGITLTRAGGGGMSGVLPNAANAMTLSFTSPTSTTMGFQLCVLPSSATSTSASVGTFSFGTSTLVQTTSSTSPARQYLMHTSSGVGFAGGTATWNFNWQTPTSYTGGATFYVALNEADGNSSSSGDNIYLKTFTATVLPVRWLDFSATHTVDGVRLKWSTAQEINNQKFEVERSDDGVNFETIHTTKGKGNSETTSYYSYTDSNPLNGKAFYRIKQIDFDGNSDYSVVVNYEPNGLDEPIVLVNASTQSVWFSQPDAIKEVIVWGLNGQVVNKFETNGNATLTLTGLQNGLYLIEINGTQGSQWMKKLLVQ